uniref:Uncharacterized protein n=1 Tax=Triticum urartu TaxID=4572 RepID=A0A8R7QVU0_TRIUA
MATRKSAQRNMVLVEAKQRCSWRFIVPPARSIFTLPGVDGKRSSSSARIFLQHAVVVLLPARPPAAARKPTNQEDTRNPSHPLAPPPCPGRRRNHGQMEDRSSKQASRRKSARCLPSDGRTPGARVRVPSGNPGRTEGICASEFYWEERERGRGRGWVRACLGEEGGEGRV